MTTADKLAEALRDAVAALAKAHIYVDCEAGPDEAEQVRDALQNSRAALAAYDAERAEPPASATLRRSSSGQIYWETTSPLIGMPLGTYTFTEGDHHG